MRRLIFAIRVGWQLIRGIPRTMRRAWATHGMNYAQALQWELRQNGTEWTVEQCAEALLRPKESP